MPDMLTISDGKDYDRLKAKVQVGIESMIDATKAAAEIRERQLWRLEYESWEDFCQAEFHTSARRMWQKMEAVAVIDLLPPGIGDKLNEEQLRAIKPAAQESPETAVEILETIERKGAKITGKAIKQEIKAQENEPPTPNANLEQFAVDVQSVVDDLKSIADQAEYYLAKDALGRISTHANNLVKALRSCKLTRTCPYCGGRGCTQCNNTGMVNETIYNLRADVLG